MEKYGKAKWGTDNMIKQRRKDAIFVPDDGRKYRHTLRMFNTYCFSIATVIMGTHCVICTLPALVKSVIIRHELNIKL